MVGESHVPGMTHIHYPYLPAAWWCKESYFPTKKEVRDGISDGRSAGNRLRDGMAVSLGLVRAGREQYRGSLQAHFKQEELTVVISAKEYSSNFRYPCITLEGDTVLQEAGTACASRDC